MKLFDEERQAKPKGSAAPKIILVLVGLAVVATAVTLYLRQTAEEPAPVEVEAPEREPAPAPKARRRPTPEREAPAAGGLTVSANIEGARLFVDGEPRGELPWDSGDLAPGTYEIRVELEGYTTHRSDVRVRAGRVEELDVTLAQAPASLRVMSDVAGASVFLDRQYLGQTPLDVDEVSAGTHQLTVSADGYDMYAETIEITTGHRDLEVSFKQVTLNESIEVLHKHRFGSCEGTLTADAAGIHYRTDHKDAFSVAFADMERFEVDYIEKNLNVKLEGGRNYNFTEKSGNADALFVFHKNVQTYLSKAP